MRNHVSIIIDLMANSVPSCDDGELFIAGCRYGTDFSHGLRTLCAIPQGF
jgi:hypothetical protein